MCLTKLGPLCGLELYKQLIHSHMFSLEPPVEWNLRSIFENCIAWLCGVTPPCATHSRGWTLSAHTPQMLFSNLIPKSIGSILSKTLESTTMFYCSGSNTFLEQHYTAQLQSIEAFAGSQMIRALEGLLQPKALAKSSKDQLIGLSILLFGELISVGFSNAKTTAWDVRPHNIVDTETSSLISTANLRVTEKCQIVL